MQLISFILPIFALAVTVYSRDCQNAPGVANGACVTYYDGCGGRKLGSYKPTCEGNCFRYDRFGGIWAAGDGTFGTNCQAFSDDNCQNYIGETGNQVFRSGCKAFQGKSMKCYYRC
ncbi:hypothetical protein TWF696_003438 [Orbilia brochopaga]|uniref:Uncharacterized protein n=1 Tax=Orbilia brochopaga TaxID=3140254 RepID=A0AAV9TX78_9PEZI